MQASWHSLRRLRLTLVTFGCVWTVVRPASVVVAEPPPGVYRMDMGLKYAGAKVADTLGDAASAEAYRRPATAGRAAVHAKFFNAADADYVNGREAYLAIALLVGLTPEGLRVAVWKRLETEILVPRNGHIHAGVFGGAFLFETLLDARRDDLLYIMIDKPDYPGWAGMLADGGTLHEDWEGRGTRLHDPFLYVGGWFIEGPGGIRPPEGDPRHRVVEPWTDQTQGRQRASAHSDSAYGRTAIDWSKTNGRLALTVTVPPNTDAVLRLHGIHAGSLHEVGAPAGVAGPVATPTTTPTDVANSIPAGHDAFRAECEPTR